MTRSSSRSTSTSSSTPGCGAEQVALRDNQVIDLLPEFLHYRADTEPGSSGSPVFNDQWELVGLHHSGVPRRDGQSRILAVGGGLWTQTDGRTSYRLGRQRGRAPEPHPPLRQGANNKHRRPTAASRRAALRPPDSAADPVSPQEPPPAPAHGVTEAGHPTAATSSVVTVSIPLQLTLQLGQPLGAVAAPPIAPVPDVTMAPVPAPLEEAVSVDPDYGNREGFDPEFLGAGPLRVDLPRLSLTSRSTRPGLRGRSRAGSPFELTDRRIKEVMFC